MIEGSLRDELVALAAKDESVRARLAETGELLRHGYHPEMETVHVNNARRLKQIISEYGWPGRSKAGKEAAGAAWKIVQHAIGDPGFQRQCLELLRDAARRDDADPLQVAMLDDRIRVFEGRPQLYGTPYDGDANGQISPYPLEDAEHVDERRASVGLGPLAEHLEEVRAAVASSSEAPPTDYEARQREFEDWARRAGWRK